MPELLAVVFISCVWTFISYVCTYRAVMYRRGKGVHKLRIEAQQGPKLVRGLQSAAVAYGSRGDGSPSPLKVCTSKWAEWSRQRVVQAMGRPYIGRVCRQIVWAEDRRVACTCSVLDSV